VACLNQHGPSAGSSQHVSADKGKDDRNTAKYSVVFSFAGSGSVRASASPRASQQPWRPDVQPSCADGAVDLNAPSEASALATLTDIGNGGVPGALSSKLYRLTTRVRVGLSVLASKCRFHQVAAKV
jgi:hypothetical protein